MLSQKFFIPKRGASIFIRNENKLFTIVLPRADSKCPLAPYKKSDLIFANLFGNKFDEQKCCRIPWILIKAPKFKPKYWQKKAKIVTKLKTHCFT